MFDRACVWHPACCFTSCASNHCDGASSFSDVIAVSHTSFCLWGFWPWVLKPVKCSQTKMSRFAAGDPPKDLTTADVTHLHIEFWRGWQAANTQPTAETLLMRFIRPVEAVGDTGPDTPQESIPWEGIVTQGSAFECWSSFLLWDHHHITVARQLSLKLSCLPTHWEEVILATYEGKKTKYSDLAAKCREVGRSTRIYPVKVVCWCIVSTSTTRQLHVVPYSPWLLPWSCHALLCPSHFFYDHELLISVHGEVFPS